MMIIRVEQENDHRAVEELTREAFWNLYVPGANEHFIVHNLRKRPEFIKELCLVAEEDKKIVGNIVFSLSVIKDEHDKLHEVITFGPLSVLPSKQGIGIGSALVKESIKIATEMGFKAIMILGYPSYYSKFGFESGQKFGICMPDGSYPKGLQVLELYKGALDGITGKYIESEAFNPDGADTEMFDRNFIPKEKFSTASQNAFAVMISLNFDDVIPEEVLMSANSTDRINEDSNTVNSNSFFTSASLDFSSNNAATLQPGIK